MKFNSDRSKMLWLEEQLRCLWEYLDGEGMADDAQVYLKDNQADLESFSLKPPFDE